MVSETLAYKNGNLDLLNLLDKELNSPVFDGFKSGRENIAFFINHVTGYKFLTRLSIAMAIDKIKGSQNAAEMLDPLIESFIIAPCMRDAEEIHRLLNEKLRFLQINTNQHRAGLMELTDNELFIVTDLGLYDGLKQINDELTQKIRGLALNHTITAAEVVVEAVMIKSTVSIIKKATVSVVGKLATTFSAGAFPAIIDGPLPIGDIIGAIIAAGGLTWTAVDIYNVSRKLPRELENAMTDMVCDLEKKSKNEAMNKLKAAIRSCEDDFDILESQCIASLDHVKVQPNPPSAQDARQPTRRSTTAATEWTAE